ncbi:MAG: hypothetical protein KDE51_23460 [Anaerolineales bacterium]|nr:hypothetical protein [Anaerolineales bacterium]
MSEKLSIIGLSILVFCSRLPFLNTGYGNDPDAWAIANAARHIATTGEYSASRLPGYPVPELLYALIWPSTPFILNAVTALLSAIGFIFFVLILRTVKSQNYMWGGLALAFSPVIFIHSTNAMDYIWGLTFILGSTYLVLRGNTLTAALFLGIAIGCRITSGAMLLPLLLLVIHQRGNVDKKLLVKFTVIACGTGALFFIPVVSEYGLGFASFYDSYPPLLWVIYSASIVVWGTIGVLALLLAIFIQVIKLKSNLFPYLMVHYTKEKLLVIASLSAIILYLIAFLRLPHDGGYLIPLIPFVILLLSRFLTRPLYIFVCIAVILSSFLITVEKNKITIMGPIFNDHQERLEKSVYAERYLSVTKNLDQKSLIVAGPWMPQMTALMPPDQTEFVELAYLIEEQTLQSYIDQGFQIYYLAGQRELIRDTYGFDLEEKGARPLVPNEKQDVKW